MGLFKNEAISKSSPFRTGPLKDLPEVEEIVFDRVSWNNHERLHSYLGDVPPEEYEGHDDADMSGLSADEAADKTAAWKPGRFRQRYVGVGCGWGRVQVRLIGSRSQRGFDAFVSSDPRESLATRHGPRAIHSAAQPGPITSRMMQ